MIKPGTPCFIVNMPDEYADFNGVPVTVGPIDGDGCYQLIPPPQVYRPWWWVRMLACEAKYLRPINGTPKTLPPVTHPRELETA